MANKTEDEAVKVAGVDATDTGVWGKQMKTELLAFKPEMFQMFYVFLGISFLLIFFILFRMHK